MTGRRGEFPSSHSPKASSLVVSLGGRAERLTSTQVNLCRVGFHSSPMLAARFGVLGRRLVSAKLVTSHSVRMLNDMEWVIGIGIAIVFIVILAFVGQQRMGAEMETRLRQERDLKRSGEWVKVRIRAITDRGDEVMWSSVGRTEDEAEAEAVDTVNRLGRSGRVVRVLHREVIERSNAEGEAGS